MALSAAIHWEHRMIGIHKVNESYARMEHDDDKELSLIYNALSYYPENYRFMPAFKNGMWDGQIHLMDASTGAFPLGLTRHVLKTAKELGIEFKVDSERGALPVVSGCYQVLLRRKGDISQG